MSNQHVTLGNLKVDTIGRFSLRVLKNPKKFRMTNIPSYIPKGKTHEEIVRFKSPDGREVESLIIGKVHNILKPDNSPADYDNIVALIGHPKVRLGGIPDDQWRALIDAGLKAPKPDFELTNLDRQSIDEVDREGDLVEARALLYSKKNPLSMEKLVWLCSFFRLGYKTQTQDPKRARVELVKKLDKYIQDPNRIEKGKNNLERFIDAVENIKRTETIFYVREMVNMGIVTSFGGMYKVGETPVGPDENSVVNWFSQNDEIFAKHKEHVIKAVRETA